MNELLRDIGNQYLKEVDGCIVVEFGFGTSSEIAEIYRALAVRCISAEVTRVLVKPGDDDPGGEHALRDAFTMMVLAGIAPGFRIALVVPAPRVEARYSLTVRDLRQAKVNAKSFATDAEAFAWLGVAGRGQRAA